jgi:hypothetical protein
MSELSSAGNDFYLKEYEALRSEIESMLSDSRSLERNVVFAVGATWAWLATHSVPKAIWWMPVFLTVLGALRSLALLKTFGIFSDYIKKIESRFCVIESIKGWETFSHPRKHWIAKTGVALWAVMVITTVSVAAYEWLH